MIRLTQTAQVSAKMEEHDEEGQSSLSYVTPDSVVRAQVRPRVSSSKLASFIGAGVERAAHSLEVTVTIGLRILTIRKVKVLLERFVLVLQVFSTVTGLGADQGLFVKLVSVDIRVGCVLWLRI